MVKNVFCLIMCGTSVMVGYILHTGAPIKIVCEDLRGEGKELISSSNDHGKVTCEYAKAYGRAKERR